VRLHREEKTELANVTTFNLDEYYALPPGIRRVIIISCSRSSSTTSIVPRACIHLPDGTVPRGEVEAHCAAVTRKQSAAGGIDFQILGIGRTGHIGFNEPGSPRRSLTRLVTLDPLTRNDAAGDSEATNRFFSPTKNNAITMGVRSILNAKRVVLMAWVSTGGDRRGRRRRRVTAKSRPRFCMEHDNAVYVLDQAAAGALTRQRTPSAARSARRQGCLDERMTAPRQFSGFRNAAERRSSS